MSTSELREAIDSILPDIGIIADVSSIIRDANGRVELEGKVISVPASAKIVIVGKAFFKEYFDVGFGTYRVQVAVGGVRNEGFGVLEAEYCFATLYYNDDGCLFTIDFHGQMR